MNGWWKDLIRMGGGGNERMEEVFKENGRE